VDNRRVRVLVVENDARMARARARAIELSALGIIAAVLLGGCDGGGSDTSASSRSATTIPQPTHAQLAAANLAKLPLAPESERVDIVAPTFSNPTEITNPLFPISDLHSAVLSGRVDGKAFHTETTLLPQTRMIEWSEGETAEARTSQYIAYLDGRIEEAALDYYAQADDGSVWYLGEDVYDYNRAGLIDGTEGTWLAGREGPPEMIMPADPQVGDVHRAENIPAVAFEEVAIKATDKTFDGPTGPVEGGMIARELHDDGAFSDKQFAPGYGEFFTGDGGDVEAMALAVPTDALDESVPSELDALLTAANESFVAVRSGDWSSAAGDHTAATQAWDTYRRGEVPPLIRSEMIRALARLGATIDARDRAPAMSAAIDVSQSALDLELRYRPPAEIDLARFELWSRQILAHAAADDLGGAGGDVASLEWIRDRFAHILDPADLTAIDVHLQALRGSVVDRDLGAIEAEATRLPDTLVGIEAAPR
jgi:hypothetical protein